MSSSETQSGAVPLPPEGGAVVRADRGGANGGQAVRLDPNSANSTAGSKTPGNIYMPSPTVAIGPTGGWQGPAITRNNANPSPKLNVPGGNDITKDAPGQA